MNKNINTNGRAALYASIYPAVERTCVANGWSRAVHGSVVTDFDLMLQPYTDKAIQVKELLYKIRAALELGNIPVLYAGKSHHNRCMFGICITENMYLDISVIDDGTIGVEHLKKGLV